MVLTIEVYKLTKTMDRFTWAHVSDCSSLKVQTQIDVGNFLAIRISKFARNLTMSTQIERLQDQSIVKYLHMRQWN